MTSAATIGDFGRFYERTYPVAYRTSYAIIGEPALAADAVQDAYLAAFRQRDRYRGDGPPDAWLMRIVVNAAISATRRRRVRWVQPLPEGLLAAGDESRRSADRLSVLAALQVLPPKERAAIVLRFYLDYDYATIARCLGTSTGTVGSWLSRAIERMRAEWDRSGEREAGAASGEGSDGA